MLKVVRRFLLLILMLSLSGCFYWVRAYQTYLQMDDFDQNFYITANNNFNILFRQPKLYNQDFISLSKLQPSSKQTLDQGESWRYWFLKVDQQGRLIQPEVRFYFDLRFNQEAKLIEWTFSELFLQIAPAEFLELSIRALGGAEINEGKRQLRANTDLIEKIDVALPKKKQLLAQLGPPLEIEQQAEKDIYLYHFQLQTPSIEEGYEDRGLSEVKLIFDKQTDELIKMSGRFIGLKISINYQKLVKKG